MIITYHYYLYVNLIGSVTVSINILLLSPQVTLKVLSNYSYSSDKTIFEQLLT